jgi:rare lipoprotein A
MKKRLGVSLAVLFASALLVGTAQGKTYSTSWYKCCNAHTASGTPFSRHNPHIVAHRTLPFGTRLLLRNPKNGRTLCVEVQDRGPYVKNRVFDVTEAGARRLGFGGIASLEIASRSCSF